jgi:uncharacterized membrane protein
MADRRQRLDQPRSPRRSIGLRYDREAFGRLTERIARFLGTGRYLVLQSVMIVLWLVWNVAAPESMRFDPYTFTFLTLILSLQAAYAAPLILLAQNRQDDRDRINLEEDRTQAVQAKADVEYLARELAAVRIAVGEVVTRDFLRAELARLERSDRSEGGKDKESRAKAKEKSREKEKAKERTNADAPDESVTIDAVIATPASEKSDESDA